MKRRSFIGRSTLYSSTILLGSNWVFADNTERREKNIFRIVTNRCVFPEVSFPEGKQVPLGWKAMPVLSEDNEPTLLYFSGIDWTNEPIYLRLTTAIDFREEKWVAAYIPDTDIELGLFKMIFAHPFQPFELEINSDYLPLISEKGIALRLTKGTGESWFFAPDSQKTDNQGLQPHILTGKPLDMEPAFFSNLYSMNSFSPFGWMGGSVQDALYELHLLKHPLATKTLKTHLSNYLDEKKGVLFENPHTIPLDGGFNSLEDFLPFTAIVGLYPDHIAVGKALDFMLKGKKENGIIGGGHITTEGCYTLAYPLAAIAGQRKDKQLAQIAVDQLWHRMVHLTDGAAVYQRAVIGGEKGFRNWGRGVTWYLLGLVKTLNLIQKNGFNNLKGVTELEDSFKKMVDMVLLHQREKGLWLGYLDHYEMRVDTSATAGIASAIAWGCRMGWLDDTYVEFAKKSQEGLKSHLSADGFLRSVSQINRGGEELQRSDYRVITQFGMGLLAQLYAALEGVG